VRERREREKKKKEGGGRGGGGRKTVRNKERVEIDLKSLRKW
jgi:hypothetical protein